MPDERSHRGAHPEDAALLAPAHWPALRSASADLWWLLDRGYALRSALALTGDRYALTQRQRLAVARGACSRTQRERRAAHRVSAGALAGEELWIDGYNVLITIEAALAGGTLLLGRDGCLRDMASLHGTYREVAETCAAATAIGRAAANWGVAKCRWLLDRPIGNSGRLAARLRALAEEFRWTWEVDLDFSPDQILRGAAAIVATSDSVVLDCCLRWCNLAPEIVATVAPQAGVIDLRGTKNVPMAPAIPSPGSPATPGTP